MRVYIAHPYTGNEEQNRDDARYIEERLRGNGMTSIVNPLAMLEPFVGAPYNDIMKISLAMLDLCDVVLLCIAWQSSVGCRRERDRAIRQGKRIIDLGDAECKNDLETAIRQLKEWQREELKNHADA